MFQDCAEGKDSEGAGRALPDLVSGGLSRIGERGRQARGQYGPITGSS